MNEIHLNGLEIKDGVQLLRKLGVTGSQTECENLVIDVKGHPLTLNLFGTFLRDAHRGNIHNRKDVKLEDADGNEGRGHAFRVMDAYVKWFEVDDLRGQRALAVLRLLGLFERPMSPECLDVLLRAPTITGLTESLCEIKENFLNLTLSKLASARLITLHPSSTSTLPTLDAHPLIREYFAEKLNRTCNEAWRTAHFRIYKHLCEATIDKDAPEIEKLQPLCQAIIHGCHAGLQSEVYTVHRGLLQKNSTQSGIL